MVLEGRAQRRKKREQHKELLAVARFGSDDALVMGRIEGFCKAVGSRNGEVLGERSPD